MANDSFFASFLPFTRLNLPLTGNPLSEPETQNNWEALREILLAIQQQLYQPGDTFSSTSLYQQIIAGGGSGFPPAYGGFNQPNNIVNLTASNVVLTWDGNFPTSNMTYDVSNANVIATNAGIYFYICTVALEPVWTADTTQAAPSSSANIDQVLVQLEAGKSAVGATQDGAVGYTFVTTYTLAPGPLLNSQVWSVFLPFCHLCVTGIVSLGAGDFIAAKLSGGGAGKGVSRYGIGNQLIVFRIA